MSQLYNQRPSEILNIYDEYVAYCLDEACAYIAIMMRDGNEPDWADKKKKNKIENGLDYLLSLQQNL